MRFISIVKIGYHLVSLIPFFIWSSIKRLYLARKSSAEFRNTLISMGLPQDVSKKLTRTHYRSQKRLTSLKAAIRMFQK
jgi:hypothetical protein